jgi:hypothetical protein
VCSKFHVPAQPNIIMFLFRRSTFIFILYRYSTLELQKSESFIYEPLSFRWVQEKALDPSLSFYERKMGLSISILSRTYLLSWRSMRCVWEAMGSSRVTRSKCPSPLYKNKIRNNAIYKSGKNGVSNELALGWQYLTVGEAFLKIIKYYKPAG